jgi:hypothetical protein
MVNDYKTICTGCNYHGTGSNLCPGIRRDEEMRVGNGKVDTYYGSSFVVPAPETSSRCPMSLFSDKNPVQEMFNRLRR